MNLKTNVVNNANFGVDVHLTPHLAEGGDQHLGIPMNSDPDSIHKNFRGL
jgi:hypothetical protein